MRNNWRRVLRSLDLKINLGRTHENVRFRSPNRLTAQSEKSPDLAVGWSTFLLLVCHFEFSPVHATWSTADEPR